MHEAMLLQNKPRH